jgi:hypothetical protein
MVLVQFAAALQILRMGVQSNGGRTDKRDRAREPQQERNTDRTSHDR